MKRSTIRGFFMICLPAVAGWSAWAWLGCSGPQSLDVAIDPQHEDAYRAALKHHPQSPRESFYAIKAQQTGKTLDEVARDDQALSTTRNPFSARNDHEAVSWGAVVYKQHCMTCHGETVEGRGPGMPAELPKMNFRNFSHRFAATLHGGAPRSWFKKISEGYTSEVVNKDGSTNAMPPFNDVLAREQIWLAITYLQSLDVYAPKKKDSEAP